MTEPLKIMPVQKVGAVGSCMASPASYASDLNRYREPSKKAVAEHALRKLEEARAADVAAHAANLPAIEANKAIRARVAALMSEVGIGEKFSQADTKSRARFPKRITRDAGWIEDLRRECPVDDGFAYASGAYERLKIAYEAYAADGVREAEAAAAAKAQEEDRRRQEKLANVELAEIILRYGLDREAEWADVLEELRKKDQRLDLAVAMSQTRNDWSEGAYRVSAAFGRFHIDTDQDKEIANCIASILADFEDGREFRDCSWNYSRLFSEAADQQLSTDIQKATERSGND